MNTLTPTDVYQIVNSVVAQATGQSNIAVVDTSSFVTVGETLLRTATENTLNAISTMVARTIFATRPYKAKLDSLRVDTQRWGAQTRKITYLYKGFEQSTDYNTDLAQPLTDGASVDMYKINKPLAVQLNFYGTNKLQKHITRFRDQLSLAFRNEEEFAAFYDGVMVEYANEIEMANEAKTRATLVNFMAGIYDSNLTVVDLVAEYNTEFGTNYTRAQLLTTYLPEFMKFVAAEVKIWSSRLTDNTSKYHANLTGYNAILRHTPKTRQKMIMYNPIFVKAESEVYSGLFNPQYLEIGDFEAVNYWQNPDAPTAIKAKPNVLNTTNGQSINGNSIELDYVMGLLYDEEALGVCPQFDYASTTPFNSAGGYFNMYNHWRFNAYNDYTENAVLFVLGEGGE